MPLLRLWFWKKSVENLQNLQIDRQTDGRYLLLTCCCVEWYYSEQSHVMLHMSFCCCFTWLFFAVYIAVILLYSSYLLPLVDPFISRSHCLLCKATKCGDLLVRREKTKALCHNRCGAIKIYLGLTHYQRLLLDRGCEINNF